MASLTEFTAMTFLAFAVFDGITAFTEAIQAGVTRDVAKIIGKRKVDDATLN